MIKELSNEIIYNDFKNKVILTEDEDKILKLMLKKYSIVKLSQECCMSERTISRIIKELKIKYENYKKLELAKLDIFTAKK